MRLGRCPECGEIINLDNIDELADGKIIGCGFAEGEMGFCDDCPCKYDDDDCKDIRADYGFTLTTVREYCG
jgi:hypothetical protein